MSKRGDFGYGSTVREYKDDSDFGYQYDDPRTPAYQGSGSM